MAFWKFTISLASKKLPLKLRKAPNVKHRSIDIPAHVQPLTIQLEYKFTLKEKCRLQILLISIN